MTGRLNQIDLATDLTLLVLHEARTIHVDALIDFFDAVDTEPFPFDDVPTTHGDVVGHARMFERIHHATIDPPTVTITDAGDRTARIVRQDANDDRHAAFADAYDDVFESG